MKSMGRTTASAAKLTEEEWRLVFSLRCRSKMGLGLSEEGLSLCQRARESDRDRYVSMDREIFEETAPAGSCVRGRQ